jgi:hypothetical protein
MKIIRTLALIFALAATTSCMKTRLDVYSEIDKKDKTITMPPGNNSMVQPIKNYFKEDGWKVYVGRGPDITEGRVGVDRTVKSYNTYNSRYTLYLDYYQFDYCLNGDGALDYSLSLVDNKTFEEVIVMSGKNCESNIAEKFINAIKGRTEAKKDNTTSNSRQNNKISSRGR